MVLIKGFCHYIALIKSSDTTYDGVLRQTTQAYNHVNSDLTGKETLYASAGSELGSLSPVAESYQFNLF
jgi:hypothetical protein